MKALTVTKPGGPLTISEVPRPRCGPDDAVLEVAACGLCRSDWHVWQGGWGWEGIRPAYPLVLGHEVAGVVAEVGTNVSTTRVGDRVTVPFHLSCGSCQRCREGLGNLCTAATFPGSDVDGGFADYMLVRHADLNCVQLPDALATRDAAALGCRYMTAWRAVDAIAQVKPGETAVVFGCGGLGLSIVNIAASLGVSVIGVDVDDEALDRARRFGASSVLNPRQCDVPQVVEENFGGAHVSFDAIGVSEASIAAIRSLRQRGRHVQVGLTSHEDAGGARWPVDRVVFRELAILGSLGNPRPDYERLLALIAAGTLRMDELVLERYPLSQAPEVIGRMDRTSPRGLACVTMNGHS